MSIKDYEGGIITKNPTTPTGPFQTGAASGVWTMDQAAEYTKQGVWPIAGNAPPYVDDVFSTYLYDGNGSSVTVNNGIDLSGEGGMVWVKNRTSTPAHAIYDTERGPSTGTSSTTNKTLASNSTSAEGIGGNVAGITSFNSNGFTTASDQISPYNVTGPSTQDYVSWSFRKQAGFFDVVTWAGNGVAGREIAHNLGSTPGMIIIKATNSSQHWVVWHNSLSASDKELYLSLTIAEQTGAAFNSTAPTSSVFTVGNNALCNLSGVNYVAYLFAHDAGGFGDNGSESIIKCGSYTGNGGSQEINLGFEPQWLMIKKSSASGSWQIIDTMRGMPVDAGSTKYLLADSSGAEYASGAEYQAQPTATGFKLGLSNDVNQSGVDFIYIAIRRPMKTPESGTDVFSPFEYTGTGAGGTTTLSTGFPVDMYLGSETQFNGDRMAFDRLRGPSARLRPNSTDAEDTQSLTSFDLSDTFKVTGILNNSGRYGGWAFKRATGFFDAVAYTGDGNATQDINHNLGVSPNMIIVKQRTNSGTQWVQWNSETPNYIMYLNQTNANLQTGGGQPAYVGQSVSSTTFRVSTDGSANQSNGSGNSYVAYLFATLAGISKVGSYTGTAADLDVDCGFTSGARFILIKRTDSTGDWYVYDSVRGIVSGNDPYLLLNSTAAEVTGTDYIDPLSSGFTVTSSAPAGLNASGGSYIFLAIA